MVVDGVFSRVIPVMCLLLQGSVLGPLIFILYMTELADNVAQHRTALHVFADNNQLYIHCRPDDVQTAGANMVNCIRAIQHWVAVNCLRLSLEKTELIWIGVKQKLLKIPGRGQPLMVSRNHITTPDIVRVLVCPAHSKLKLRSKCFFQLRQLCCIRCSLNNNSIATLVHMFVANHIDTVFLLAGTPKKTTDKLQCILNAAA